jgi:hypothetical protein
MGRVDEGRLIESRWERSATNCGVEKSKRSPGPCPIADNNGATLGDLCSPQIGIAEVVTLEYPPFTPAFSTL